MLSQPLYLGDRVQCPTPYGYLFAHPQDVGITTWLAGGEGWEPEITRLWKDWIRPQDVVIDIGANVGWFSLVAKAHGASTIHSFECNPELFKLLYRTSLINPCPDQWHCYCVALSEVPGFATLSVDPALNGGGTLGTTYAIDAYSVATQPLDGFELTDVAAIKIDVEGHEFHVWKGMQKTLNQSPNCKVLMEWNPTCLEGNGVNPLDLANAIMAKYPTVFNARTGQSLTLTDLCSLQFGDIAFGPGLA